jgi:hypothetical protein
MPKAKYNANGQKLANPDRVYRTLMDVTARDVYDLGFDTSELTDFQMQEVARTLPDEILMRQWHDSLEGSCIDVGLKKRPDANRYDDEEEE